MVAMASGKVGLSLMDFGRKCSTSLGVIQFGEKRAPSNWICGDKLLEKLDTVLFELVNCKRLEINGKIKKLRDDPAN